MSSLKFRSLSHGLKHLLIVKLISAHITLERYWRWGHEFGASAAHDSERKLPLRLACFHLMKEGSRELKVQSSCIQRLRCAHQPWPDHEETCRAKEDSAGMATGPFPHSRKKDRKTGSSRLALHETNAITHSSRKTWATCVWIEGWELPASRYIPIPFSLRILILSHSTPTPSEENR